MDAQTAVRGKRSDGRVGIEVVGGCARVAGTWLPVAVIAWAVERRGLTPAALARLFPGLTVGGVRAALAYAEAHRREILDDMDLLVGAGEVGACA